MMGEGSSAPPAVTSSRGTLRQKEYVMQYPIKRTPEEGHTPACWVKAITCALENERDALRDVNKGDDEAGSHDFRLWLQDNGPLQWAEEYLANGDTECLCEPIKTRTINTTLGKVRFYN